MKINSKKTNDENEKNYKNENINLNELLFGDDEENTNYNPKDFVTISDPSKLSSDDFEIIQDKKSFKHVFKTIFKVVFTTLFIVLFISLILFASLFKVIPEKNIYGSILEIGDVSIISKNYTLPSSKEWKSGDIIYLNKTPDWIPYIYSYESYEFISSKGTVIYCYDNLHNKTKVFINEINFISKKQILNNGN